MCVSLWWLEVVWVIDPLAQLQGKSGRFGSAPALSAREPSRLVPHVRDSEGFADGPNGLWVSVPSLNMGKSSFKQNPALEYLQVLLKSNGFNFSDSQALQTWPHSESPG